MRGSGQAFLDRAGVARADQRFDYVVYGRYEYQSWEIEVVFAPTGGQLAVDDVPTLAATFHQMHQRIYGVKDEEDRVEFVTWKVRAVGLIRHPDESEDSATPVPADSAPLTPNGRRSIVLDLAAGAIDAALYAAARVPPGATIPGPAVIADETTTIVVHPRSTVDVDSPRKFHRDDGMKVYVARMQAVAD